MIATMRADIDNLDEYVRNTTSRAFAVVASALGVPSLLPFLKAVCQSRLSWQARHTGIKICQQVRASAARVRAPARVSAFRFLRARLRILFPRPPTHEKRNWRRQRRGRGGEVRRQTCRGGL